MIKQLAARVLNALLPQSRNRTVYVPVNNTTGIYVDHDVALTFDAVFAAVKIISESIGVLGFHRFNRRPGGGKQRLDRHPATTVLNKQWNPYMSAQIGREVLTHHALLRGNGYAEIVRDNAGRLAELWPLLPDRMHPHFQANQLVYRYRVDNGQYIDLRPDEVLHIKGLGFDGVQGYDVVRYMARTIGHGIAAEEYAGSFFGNGAHLSGALFSPKEIGKDGRKALREEFESAYKGSRNAFRMAVFEDGLEWKQFSTTPEAAQMIQTRKFSVNGVSRWFRVPPHKLGDLDKASFSNIEHQSLEFVVETLLTWVVRWEQEADMKLIGQAERHTAFHKMNLSTLLRGDQKSRFEAYQIGREWGWLSANDILEMEDRDPLPANVGDVYIVPMNYQRADQIGQQQPPPSDPPPDDDQDDDDDDPPPNGPGEAGVQALAHVAERLQAREAHGMSNVWGKDDYPERMTKFFNRHLEVMHAELRPIMGLYAQHQGLSLDDTRIDATLRAVLGTWCDRRITDWIAAAQANEKIDPKRVANDLTDQCIDLFTGGFE